MSMLLGLLVMLAFAAIYAGVAAMVEARAGDLAAALAGQPGGNVSTPRSRVLSLA